MCIRDRRMVARDMDYISQNFFVYEEEHDGKLVYKADKYALSDMDFSMAEGVSLYFTQQVLQTYESLGMAKDALKMCIRDRFSMDSFGMWTVVPIAASVVMVILATQIRRRTARGAQWSGRILGLKHFIETVEADKLKMLVESDPKYFYSILPYAYRCV